MTHRIEPLFKNHFSIWLKVLNSLNDSQSWIFFLNITQRIEPFFLICFKELNPFLNMIQRIEFLSDIYDSKSKNRTFFFSIRLNESNTFFCMWFMFSNDLKNFFWVQNFSNNWFFIWLKEWYLTQRLEIYVFEIWFKELDFFFNTRRLEAFFSKIMTQRIKPFFCMTQRIEPFFVWRKELNLFFLFAAKNWAFSF